MAPLVVDRYILFECLKAWLGVVVVLLVLTLGVGFARFIAEAAAGNLAVATVFTVATFSLVENLEIVLPVSLLLAIMLTVGRLCTDNELAVLAAGGVGLARLYRPFGLLAIVLAGLSAWLSLFTAPQVVRSLQTIENAGGAALMQVVEPGQFTVLDGGNVVFYAGSINEDSGRMRNVFVRVRARPDADKPGETVVTAATAVQERDAASGRRTLVLRDGRRYEGVPGEADFRVTRFAEHGLRIRAPAAATASDDVETRATTALLANSDPEATAELQDRLSIPLSLLLLALLAVPLGYVPPRAGRYGKLVLGIVVYVAYANVLRLGKVWVAESVVPPAVGLWWVHGIVLALAIALIGRWEGWWQRDGKPA